MPYKHIYELQECRKVLADKYRLGFSRLYYKSLQMFQSGWKMAVINM